MGSDNNKLITGFIAGALVGVAAALLLAPKSGRETREMVATRAAELRQRADELRQRAGSYVGNLRNRGNASDDYEDAEIDRSIPSS